MKRLFGLAATLGLVYGCMSGVQPPNDNDDGSNNGRPNVPGLRTFDSETEFHSYLMGQVSDHSADVRTANGSVPGLQDLEESASDGGSPAPPAAALEGAPGAGDFAGAPSAVGADADDSGFSGTTIQETGVDEADVVKTDGSYLYVLTNDWTSNGAELKIIQVSPLAVVSETRLSGYGHNLYLHGDKLVALTEVHGGFEYGGWQEGGIAVSEPGVAVDPVAISTDGGGSDGSFGALPPELIDEDGATSDGDAGMDEPAPDIAIDFLPPRFFRPRTAVTIIDLANRAAPQTIGTYEFDGWQSDSRMIDGVLRLVVSNYQYYYFDIMPLMGRPGAEETSVNPTDMIPKYKYTDPAGQVTTGDLISWQDMYRPVDEDGFGVVALVTLDVDNSARFQAMGLVAEPGLIYSSTESLYITNTKYDFDGTARSTTTVYKLDYTADNAVAVATGSVSGRILNQYSMSEHNGNLRVATTIDPIWSPFDGQVTEPVNGVYVMAESNGELATVGRIENIAPGETIQAARFLGDRGYLVTFEQVDPLFTLDLSQPTSPRIVGELKVPGFSTFIVPMDQNHILTVGEYIPETGGENWFRNTGVQLSIFDVTDFANPVLEHNVAIGGNDSISAYSEALWSPKAFTYFSEEGLVALPIRIEDTSWYQDGWIETLPPATDDGMIVEGEEGDVDEDVDADDIIADIVEDPGVFVDPWIANTYEGLIVYRVSTDTGFAETGRINTRFDDQNWFYSGFTRGVFIGDQVYAVTDGGVRAAPADSAGNVSSEIFYGPDLSAWDDFVNGDDAVAVDEEVAESSGPSPGVRY